MHNTDLKTLPSRLVLQLSHDNKTLQPNTTEKGKNIKLINNFKKKNQQTEKEKKKKIESLKINKRLPTVSH